MADSMSRDHGHHQIKQQHVNAQAQKAPEEPPAPAKITQLPFWPEPVRGVPNTGRTRVLFTLEHFLELLERERQWFEILILAGLSPGASPAHQLRMMLVERSR